MDRIRGEDVFGPAAVPSAGRAASSGSFTAGRRATLFSLWRLGRALVTVDHVVTCPFFKVQRLSVGAVACSVLVCCLLFLCLLFTVWGLPSLING